MKNQFSNNMMFKKGASYALGKMLGGVNEDGDMYSGVTTLLIVCAILIAVFMYAAYEIEKKTAKKEKRKIPSLLEYLGFSDKYSWTAIGVGMVSNVVFGFIDNAGLFFGMDSLDVLMPQGDDKITQLTQAGLGNTFSDALGAFLGTFSGNMISNVTGIKDTPLWSEVIGIIIGCLLGLYIPRYIKETMIN